MRRLVLAAVLLAVTAHADEPQLTLPLVDGSCRFAVIGDTGTGDASQYRVGAEMAEVRRRFPFGLVLMLGDNIYGRDTADDMKRKFEEPYKPLLDAGVVFHASLGNHDDPSQRFYARFNMGGERYYTYTCPRDSVRFFALDTNYMTPDQVDWLGKSLRAATERWKICYFHHPIYSTGKAHGSDIELRKTLEPLFVAYGVDVVFSGHDHMYERFAPQKGITYFVSGAAGKLRPGDAVPEPGLTAKTFDAAHHFVLVEVAGDGLSFQAISETGTTVDSGTIPRRATLAPPP
jgi:calcineurin-like phosphoesterase family protein